MTIIIIIFAAAFAFLLGCMFNAPVVDETDLELERLNYETDTDEDKEIEIKELLGLHPGPCIPDEWFGPTAMTVEVPSDEPPEHFTEEETTGTYYTTVPLDIAIQEHITDVFDKYLSYTDFVDEGGAALILAIIKVESGFKEDAVTGSCIGLMQVSTIHEKKLLKWGITNLRNPFDNIEAGIRILKECYDYASELPFNDNYTIVDMALIAYNRGVSGLLEFLKTGETTNTYVDKVYKAYKEIVGGD